MIRASRLPWALIAMLSFGCGGNMLDVDPTVVPGTDDGVQSESPAGAPSLIRQAQRDRSGGDDPAAAVRAYVKRDGLFVDVPFLAGRRLSVVPEAVLADQAGAFIEELSLGEGRVERRHERLVLRVWNDRIYEVVVTLPHPMDRSTALGVSGFPLDLGAGIDATNEWRVDNYWNLRRISLTRLADGSEQFVELRAHKWMANELEFVEPWMP